MQLRYPTMTVFEIDWLTEGIKMASIFMDPPFSLKNL